jgi:hypothetical protein
MVLRNMCPFTYELYTVEKFVDVTTSQNIKCSYFWELYTQQFSLFTQPMKINIKRPRLFKKIKKDGRSPKPAGLGHRLVGEKLENRFIDTCVQLHHAFHVCK